MMLPPLILLMLTLADDQVSAAADFYTAAVVEYAVPELPSLSADQVLMTNAANYVAYMANASTQQVDIIVFPEGGLRGHHNARRYVSLPSPSENIAPCDFNTSFHPALVLLSCAARQLNLYTVINLGEEFFNATTNKTEYYNSNVVFDRNGTAIGRYRKYNPYGEAVTRPAVPDHHTFDTDFGVRFGMFTCFDIDFLEPGVVLAREYGVKHFVFPHCWISELPFLTALQAQWGWAYSLNVVLLASGCNDPKAGGTGSGIYHGRQGALDYFQTNAHTSRLIVAKVSKTFNTDYDSHLKKYSEPFTYTEPVNKNLFHDTSGMHEVKFLNGGSEPKGPSDSNTSLAMLKDYMDVYRTISMLPPGVFQDLTKSNQGNGSLFVNLTTETTLCQNAFCCDFQVQMMSSFDPNPPRETDRGDDFSHYYYRLVVLDGVRWYGGGIATGGIQVCGIVSCVNNSKSSCGLRSDDPSRHLQAFPDANYGKLYKTSTVFGSISILPNFHYNSTFVYPDVLVTGDGNSFGALLPSDKFSFDTFGPFNNSFLCKLEINSPIDNLVTAAVYARQFDRDGQKRTEPSTSFAHPQPQSIFVFCALFLFIFHFIFSKIF